LSGGFVTELLANFAATLFADFAATLLANFPATLFANFAATLPPLVPGAVFSMVFFVVAIVSSVRWVVSELSLR